MADMQGFGLIRSGGIKNGQELGFWFRHCDGKRSGSKRCSELIVDDPDAYADRKMIAPVSFIEVPLADILATWQLSQ